MAVRRSEEEARTVEDTAGAKALATELKDRASRLKHIPGLLDGGLEEVRSSIERVLREYGKVSRRRLGPFQRDLESIAKRAEELADEGRLSPRHRKLVAQALQHARRVHFWNVRRSLSKLEKALAPAQSWLSDLEAYRAFHRKATQRVRAADDTLTELRAVPKPTASRDDIRTMRLVIETCNRAADGAWAAFTHRP
ncbi:MAG TPA: hypothetical protein VGR51_07580, partial [Thermoplasmata archaeon]|nr:hypothetical protein [Thermoplasmata archaeon]